MSELNIPVIDFEDEVFAEVWADGVDGLDDEEIIEALNTQVAEIAEFDGKMSAAKTINDLIGISMDYHLYVECHEPYDDLYTRDQIEDAYNTGKEDAGCDKDDLENYEDALAFADAKYFRSYDFGGLYPLGDAEIASTFNDFKRDMAFYFVSGFGMEL